MAEPLNTGLSSQQVLTAFDRALNDYTDAEIDALLGAKQDTIADLSEIRSGAAAGATAVQPSVFETDQARQETEIGVVANAGAKNLLKIIATSQTKNGVTFSINSDGSVSINGTATSSTTFALNDKLDLPYGQYILSGNVPSNVYLTARSTSGTNYTVTNSNTEIEIDADIYYAYINISSGTALDNVAIKPMIRPASITDDTFVPYAPTNRELYETCETKVTLTDIYGVKPSIASGTDLNNMTTPGCYACGGASLAVSLLNCPTTTDAFIMYVDHIADESRSIQRLYAFNTTTGLPAVYIRSRYSGGWSAWYKFEGTVVS